MEWQIFIIGTILTVLFSALGTFGLIILNGMKDEMRETKESAKEAIKEIKEIGLQMAVVIKNVEYHDKNLERHDDRIKKLEEKNEIR